MLGAARPQSSLSWATARIPAAPAEKPLFGQRQGGQALQGTWKSGAYTAVLGENYRSASNHLLDVKSCLYYPSLVAYRRCFNSLY